MAASIFPTFFFGGFECSTFLWKDGQRKDYLALTGHDRHLEQDCARVEDLGIGVVREGIPWPFVDKGTGSYDFDGLARTNEAMHTHRIQPIWDLFHYGLPDGCSPFDADCRKRFVDYAHAVAEFLVPRSDGTRFFTPINEITFFSAGATSMEWMYPFAKGREKELKRALCQMDIEAVRAIREVDPNARMVHVDPMIHSVPADASDEEQARRAWEIAYEEAYEAWDMLAGRLAPELGGSPEILDIVGANVYFFSQAQVGLGGEREILQPQDPRRRPLSEMLEYAWNRYHRPMIIGETSGYQDRRAEWLRTTMEQCLIAINRGVDLHGVCLYPVVDIPDWNTGEWAQIGIFDVGEPETLGRTACQPYVDELRRWQRALNAPEQFQRDDARVDLAEVRRFAGEWAARQPDPATTGLG